MNFSSTTRDGEIYVELKYCERCGGLWLRRPGQDNVYCGGCRARLATLLRTDRRRSFEPRLPHGPAQIDCLLGVAEMAVRS